MEFHDRRPHARPDDDDYATPLTRQTVADANARVRAAQPDYRLADTEHSLRNLTVKRHRARKAEQGDFDSVGSYLEFVTGLNSSS